MVHNDKGALAIVCAYQVVPQIQVLDWQAGLTINTGRSEKLAMGQCRQAVWVEHTNCEAL